MILEKHVKFAVQQPQRPRSVLRAHWDRRSVMFSDRRVRNRRASQPVLIGLLRFEPDRRLRSSTSHEEHVIEKVFVRVVRKGNNLNCVSLPLHVANCAVRCGPILKDEVDIPAVLAGHMKEVAKPGRGDLEGPVQLRVWIQNLGGLHGNPPVCSVGVRGLDYCPDCRGRVHDRSVVSSHRSRGSLERKNWACGSIPRAISGLTGQSPGPWTGTCTQHASLRAMWNSSSS